MTRGPLLTLILVLCATLFVRLPGADDRGFDPLEARGRQVELAIETRQFSDALPVALELRRLHPRDPLVLFWLAEIYRGLDRPRDEVSAWEAYLRLSSAPEEACPWLPLAEVRAGNTDEALRRYRDCVSFAPDDPQRLLDLAAAQAERHQKSEALLTYAQAVALDPHDPSIPRRMEALGATAGNAW